MADISTLKKVETRVVEVPMDKPIGTRDVYFTKTYLVLIRATDHEGVEGYSLLWCLRPDLPELLEATCRYMGRQVIGKDITKTGEVASLLAGAAGFVGRLGLTAFGAGAVKMAIEDIICRRLGVSLADHMGKVRTHVPAYMTGLFLSYDMDTLLEEAKWANNEGFRAMKLWLGSEDLGEDLERMQAVKDVITPGTKLMIDVSMSWSLPEATRAIDAVCELDPFWIEDPLVYWDILGLRRVVHQSSRPVCTGENLYLPESFREILDAGVQYLEPDLERLGGLREWAEVAAMAAPYGAMVVPHCYHNVGLQLCATLRQAEVWVEYVPWWQTIFVEDFKVVDGMIEVPVGPGIGVNFDNDVVDDLALGDWKVAAD